LLILRLRQSKLFFDLEKKACEELSVVAMKASADSEHILVQTEKHLQLCETYSSSDQVIEGLIANQHIGTPCFDSLCFTLLTSDLSSFFHSMQSSASVFPSTCPCSRARTLCTR
jgi:hypothetical protein